MTTSVQGSIAGAMILNVSDTLSDQATGAEYSAWSKDVLAGFLTEGMCQLLALRPDAFASVETIALQAGAAQTLPSSFHSLLDISDADTADNSDDGAMRSDNDVLRRFGKPPCLVATPGTVYALKTFSVNANVKTAFNVFPPVPVGTVVSVRATVVKLPTIFTAANLTQTIGISCEYDAPLVDWMLMRAYGTETESASSATLARTHRDAFYAAFNTNYLQARRFQSGYYLGQEGSGDERFRVH